MHTQTESNGSKVYIYTRVSTAMQVDGYSLEAQKEEILNYAKYKHMQVCREYSDEGKSGKNIQGRPGFQQMIDDIVERKDGVAFVLVFKLSRFGRSTADILNTLKIMQRYGVHLICVKDNIDSSLDSGKMMIAILGAMAEIERANILEQTMAGRREKARQGKWNGAKPPYGYTLEDGKLVIKPEEAEHIRIIFEKYVHTNAGFAGVAKSMNEQGYKKFITTHNGLDVFTEPFIEDIINNYAYVGKIAYERRKNVPREDAPDEYHKIETKDFSIYPGKHKAIIDEELWNAAQAKKKAHGGRRAKIEKDHEYIYSGLLKCPKCGKSLYGVPMRGRRRKDGTLYPTYYSYMCRSQEHVNGIECGFGQISCTKIDDAMFHIISGIVNDKNFGATLERLVGEQVDTLELEQVLDTATKEHRQALAYQRKIECELFKLDTTDKHYDRKYESLSRRLDEVFDKIDDAEARINDCEARIASVKQQCLTRDSVYESLKLFDDLYILMSDFERKQFVQTFIDSIELYPNKNRKNGCPIKTIHFKFPVAYNGSAVYTFSPPVSTTDETVVLLSNKNSKPKSYVEIGVDADDYYRIKEGK